MPPKKKLKSATKVDDQAHCSNICESFPESPEIELTAPKTEEQLISLSLLPADVLLYMYKFLSPIDLASLYEVGDPKINELVYFQKEVNFSACRRTNFELVSCYFSRERVKYIQKLNFNYYIYAKPCDIVQLICKCKKLLTLSIVECGIQYKQLLTILKNCSVLKELTWNVKEAIFEEATFCSSVTKLYLFSHILDSGSNVSSIQKIVKNFPKSQNATICFCPSSIMIPPFIGSWITSSSHGPDFNLNSSKRKGITLNVLNNLNPDLHEIMRTYPERIIEDLRYVFDPYYNHPPFLKAKTNEQDLSLLSSCSPNTYSSIIVQLTTSTGDVYENVFNCVSKIGGSKLKQLSIEHEEYEVIPEGMHLALLHDKMSYLLESVFLNCQNITALNIGTVHFTSTSPFRAICCLKNLEVLSMPTCAFPKKTKSVGLANQQDQCSDFEELTSKCSKVEDFHLVCCNTNRGSMQDTEIFPIQNWKRLKSFSIYYVIFRTCRFLRKIADFCPEFQMFSLIMTFPNSGCIFYDDVTYLLMNAKKMTFIRINDTRFNPLFGRFMNAISSAQNLEGICFMTNCETCFTSSSIVNSIKSLKYLHLFHFYAPRVSSRLFQEVRKSMDKNGIKNIKVEKCFGEFYLHNDNHIVEREGNAVQHYKPFFTCLQLHLKNFLFEGFSL